MIETDTHDTNESVATDMLQTKATTNAPRICGLYLTHIQSYSEPTFIPFSLDKTVIRGRNDAGKSVIEKSLKLFGGMFDENDYACLVHYDFTAGQILLYLSNRTILAADISVEVAEKGTERERRKGKVQFCLYNWQMTAVLKKWDKYSPEIPEYLGWISLTDEKLCVNFVDGKRNILINTNEKVNTALTDVVCRNIDLETRLSNISRALKVLTETKKNITAQRKMLRDMISDFDLPAAQLSNLKNQITVQLFICNIGVWTSELTTDKLVLVEKLNQLRTVRNIMTLLYMKPVMTSIEALHVAKSKYVDNKQLQFKLEQLLIVQSMSNLLTDLNRLNIIRGYQNSLLIKHTGVKIVHKLISFIRCITSVRDISLKLAAYTDKKSSIETVVERKARFEIRLKLVGELNEYIRLCKLWSSCVLQVGFAKASVGYIRSIQVIQLSSSYIEQMRISSHIKLQYANFLLLKMILTTVQQYMTILKAHADIREVRAKLQEIPICPTCGQVVGTKDGEHC